MNVGHRKGGNAKNIGNKIFKQKNKNLFREKFLKAEITRMGKETKLSLLKTRIHASQYLTIFGTNLKWNGLH